MGALCERVTRCACTRGSSSQNYAWGEVLRGGMESAVLADTANNAAHWCGINPALRPRVGASFRSSTPSHLCPARGCTIGL